MTHASGPFKIPDARLRAPRSPQESQSVRRASGPLRTPSTRRIKPKESLCKPGGRYGGSVPQIKSKNKRYIWLCAMPLFCPSLSSTFKKARESQGSRAWFCPGPRCSWFRPGHWCSWFRPWPCYPLLEGQCRQIRMNLSCTCSESTGAIVIWPASKYGQP